MNDRLTMTSDKGGVAFTFDLDITCEKSEITKILKVAQKLKEYEEIGTVEECREAREKQEPMCLNDRETPFIGKSTKIQFRCPQCGIILGIGISKKPIIQKEIRHCYNCGQKLYR